MWRDDMELGAVELHLALRDATSLPSGLPVTDPAAYLGEAAHWARAYLNQSVEQHDTFNLYDVSGLAHVELIRALGEAGDPTDLPVSVGDLTDGLQAQLDQAAAESAADPFGFGSGHGDPAPHAFGLSAEAAWFDQVTGTSRYTDLQASQLSWALGANAWGSSFVIGAGSVFPHCPQDQPANIVGSLDGTGNILLGGGVDGPSGYIPTGSSGRRRRRRARPTGRTPSGRSTRRIGGTWIASRRGRPSNRPTTIRSCRSSRSWNRCLPASLQRTSKRPNGQTERRSSATT